jgi:hypothetical protein
MDHTIIIILIFLFITGYFVYSLVQRQRQFNMICSDEHLLEIREIFEELYEEVWEAFIQTQEENENTSSENKEETGDESKVEINVLTEEKPKYRLTSQNFLITYKIMPIKLHNKDLLINHFSFSSVNSYFFPANLVYMGIYFSIILDIAPENFDYTVHQANRGTSGFLFCKTNKQEDLLKYKKTLQIITTEESFDENQRETIEENSDTQDDIIDLEKTEKEETMVSTVSLSLKDVRSKIEELCPHIQIQKV